MFRVELYKNSQFVARTRAGNKQAENPLPGAIEKAKEEMKAVHATRAVIIDNHHEPERIIWDSEIG